MTGDGEDAPAAPEDDAQRDVARGDVPWLLRHKVALSDPLEGWVEREELEARCVLTERRLTVLRAPGGFGKTALLGQCCRALREEGVAVAWLSLDEEDGPDSLAVYLAHAFEKVNGAGRRRPPMADLAGGECV